MGRAEGASGRGVRKEARTSPPSTTGASFRQPPQAARRRGNEAEGAGAGGCRERLLFPSPHARSPIRRVPRPEPACSATGTGPADSERTDSESGTGPADLDSGARHVAAPGRDAGRALCVHLCLLVSLLVSHRLCASPSSSLAPCLLAISRSFPRSLARPLTDRADGCLLHTSAAFAAALFMDNQGWSPASSRMGRVLLPVTNSNNPHHGPALCPAVGARRRGTSQRSLRCCGCWPAPPA